MEVLGQILKNRAGSFEKSEVEEILEDTIDLGLRILNVFLNQYREPEFEEWLMELLKEAEKELKEKQNKEFTDEKRKAFIGRAIQLFGYLVTSGMLSIISEAISTGKLLDTMSLLSSKKSTPAYELITYLVSSSQREIDVSYVKSLLIGYNKTKNHWAKKTLSYYVQNYLNTHKVKYSDRQKLFSALELKYLPNKS